MNQFTVSLWGDEGWAIHLAVKPLIEIVRLVAKDTSPPLYYFFLHGWTRLFGTSEISIRSLSFLFFLVTVLATYFIGRKLWDRKTGFLAGLLAFFNPFLLHYAFEGRMYAILAMVCTLSVLFFVSKKRWAFILASAAALYSHHFAVFVLVWLGIWRLKEVWGKPFKQILLGLSDFFFIGLLYLPWVYPLYYQTSLVQSGFWLGKPTLPILRETIEKFFVGKGEESLRQIAYWSIAAALVLKQWLKDKEKTIFLLGWFFSPLLITYFLSQLLQPIFFDRYLLAVIPAGCLLVASLSRKASLAPILIAVACLAVLDWHYFTHPTKQPFEELAKHVHQEAAELTLINYNAAAHHLWETKYYGLEAPIYTPTPLPFYTGTALMTKSDIIYELPQEKELGIITSAPPQEIKLPNYQIKTSRSFGNLHFLVAEKKQ